jgi:hypothetical protein
VVAFVHTIPSVRAPAPWPIKLAEPAGVAALVFDCVFACHQCGAAYVSVWIQAASCACTLINYTVNINFLMCQQGLQFKSFWKVQEGRAMQRV